MTLYVIGAAAIAVAILVGVGLMVFKDESTSIRDGVVIVVSTWGVLYASVVPNKVPALVLVLLTIGMWAVLSGAIGDDVSRRLADRVRKRQGPPSLL
jgi:hypothetical protein